ncbi:MAG: mycothiol conjugate amidase Mca [Actinobacteria bacterium]|nr:mycothiol conjugate amidase Mca [Actinomycetota bacterium]
MSTVPIQPPIAGEPLRLLAVHAHPDDESSKGAASTAKYVSEGVQVAVVSCTGGERGDVLNPQFDLAGRDIGLVRREEMSNAARVLGIEHIWLGFEDSGFPDGDPKPPLPPGCFADISLEQAAAPLIDVVRRFRPHVMTTYDENGGYPHPDHIRTHEVSMYAWEKSGDPSFVTTEQPWTVAKMYYNHTFTRARVVALHDALLKAGLDSPYNEWLDGWSEQDDNYERVTTRVPCAEYFEIRDEALKAHATQIDPAGSWFAVPHDLQIEIWPTEDFELARSRIGDITNETDLFEGLRV